MTTHNEHHFVPAFLLRSWQSLPDEKLTQFEWIPRPSGPHLHSEQYKAKAVAKQRYLYSVWGSNVTPDNLAETEFFTPDVDGPAAPLHQIILRDGIKALTLEQRIDWTRFLVAQLHRVPNKVREIRRRARQHIIDDMEAKFGAPLDHETMTLPMLDDIGIKALPYIIESNILNAPFLKANWGQIRLHRSSVDLLISDNPVLLDGDLASDFLIALPLSPRLVFVAYRDENVWQGLLNAFQRSPTELAKMFNRETVNQAEKYVYSTGTAHEPLIRKHLKQPRAEV